LKILQPNTGLLRFSNSFFAKKPLKISYLQPSSTALTVPGTVYHCHSRDTAVVLSHNPTVVSEGVNHSLVRAKFLPLVLAAHSAVMSKGTAKSERTIPQIEMRRCYRFPPKQELNQWNHLYLHIKYLAF